MKLIFTSFIAFLPAMLFAQIDSNSPTIDIPAIEVDTSQIEAIIKAPDLVKPQDNELAFKVKSNLDEMEIGETPRKEFSMVEENKFLNNSERFQKKFDKENIKLSSNPKYIRAINELKGDINLGDYETNSKFIYISIKDHGFVDGDIINIFHNNDIIKHNVSLLGNYKKIKLYLVEGINKLDFLALNEGTSRPNTAEYYIVDGNEILISNKKWRLIAGYKASIIILKK